MKFKFLQKLTVLSFSAAMVLSPIQRANAYDVWDAFISLVIGGVSGGTAGYFAGKHAGEDEADDIKKELEEDIEALETLVDEKCDLIDTNTGNIATNTGNIATNTGNIATNTSNIATNTSDIATNTGNIATNTSNISTNSSNIATNTSNIATNTGDIAGNATDIATNETNIASNASAISANSEMISLTKSELMCFLGGDLNTPEHGTAEANPTVESVVVTHANSDVHEVIFEAPNGLTAGPYVVTTSGFLAGGTIALPNVAGTWNARMVNREATTADFTVAFDVSVDGTVVAPAVTLMFTHPVAANNDTSETFDVASKPIF